MEVEEQEKTEDIATVQFDTTADDPELQAAFIFQLRALAPEFFKEKDENEGRDKGKEIDLEPLDRGDREFFEELQVSQARVDFLTQQYGAKTHLADLLGQELKAAVLLLDAVPKLVAKVHAYSKQLVEKKLVLDERTYKAKATFRDFMRNRSAVQGLFVELMQV